MNLHLLRCTCTYQVKKKLKKKNLLLFDRKIQHSHKHTQKYTSYIDICIKRGIIIIININYSQVYVTTLKRKGNQIKEKSRICCFSKLCYSLISVYKPYFLPLHLVPIQLVGSIIKLCRTAPGLVPFDSKLQTPKSFEL